MFKLNFGESKKITFKESLVTPSTKIKKYIDLRVMTAYL